MQCDLSSGGIMDRFIGIIPPPTKLIGMLITYSSNVSLLSDLLDAAVPTWGHIDNGRYYDWKHVI